MAKTSSVTLAITVNGDGGALQYAPPGGAIINLAAPVGGPSPQVLSATDNTISIPSGTQGLLIVPPSTSTVNKKLKGSGMDTGVQISQTLPTMLSFPAGATTLIINANGSETITLLWL